MRNLAKILAKTYYNIWSTFEFGRTQTNLIKFSSSIGPNRPAMATALFCAPAAASLSVPDAIHRWLTICETEGTDGNDPVTGYTLSLYRYHAGFMKDYEWSCALVELTTPDVVDFRSWLIEA